MRGIERKIVRGVPEQDPLHHPPPPPWVGLVGCVQTSLIPQTRRRHHRRRPGSGRRPGARCHRLWPVGCPATGARRQGGRKGRVRVRAKAAVARSRGRGKGETRSNLDVYKVSIFKITFTSVELKFKSFTS